MKLKRLIWEATGEWNRHHRGGEKPFFDRDNCRQIIRFYKKRYRDWWEQEFDQVLPKEFSEDLQATIERIQSWERINWIAIPIFLAAIGYVCLEASFLLVPVPSSKSVSMKLISYSIALAVLGALAVKVMGSITRLLYVYTFHAWILETVLRRGVLSFSHKFVKHISVDTRPGPPRSGLTRFLILIYYACIVFGLFAVVVGIVAWIHLSSN